MECTSTTKNKNVLTYKRLSADIMKDMKEDDLSPHFHRTNRNLI